MCVGVDESKQLQSAQLNRTQLLRKFILMLGTVLELQATCITTVITGEWLLPE